MKLDSIVTMRAQRNSFISDASRDLKARQEQHRYTWHIVSTGYYACVNNGSVHVIEDNHVTIGCSCMDMTHRCRPGEVCKHVIAFTNLSQLPVLPVTDEIDALLRDQGWTGERLLRPPDEAAQAAQAAQAAEALKPSSRPAYNEPRKELKKTRDRFEGMTPAQMCRAMDDKELRMNARKGGVAAIAEMKRRKERNE